MILIQIESLFLSLTRKKSFQQISQKKIQINHKEKILTEFLKIRIFWSNSEREQTVVTFKKCFILSRKLTSWICFNNNMNTAIQCLKKWKNHDFASYEFKNYRNKYYSNSKILLMQEYDYHALFIKLQFLISLFKKEACQNMFSD